MRPPHTHAPASPTQVLRQALSQFTTGIAVITTTTPEGSPVGLTANSFSSVSLDPPLVLWSLSLQAASLNVFRRCARYLIHVLSADQLELAKRFATRGADRFGPASGTVWQPNASGLPVLEGGLARFECINRSQHEEGDHIILVGQVDTFCAPGGMPLAFHAGKYLTHFTETPLPQSLQSPWDAGTL